MNFLLGGLGIVDILVILNILEGKKNNKQLARANRLTLMIALMQEQDQEEIIKILKEIRDARKN
jgi:hypothetical protein